jgi:hypothetical protein
LTQKEQIMKSRFIIFALAAIVAIVISLTSNTVPLEQKLIRIHVIERLSEFPGIENESIELQAALADVADDPLLVLKVKAAMFRYPAMARELLPIYSSSSEFQEILREYGESVLPAIHYFVSNPVGSIEWMSKAGKQYESIKSWFVNSENDTPASEPAPELAQSLTPTDRGWHAIQYIRAEGHDFIGQFVVNPEGQVEWIVTERVMEGLTQFFSSGIRQLETRYKMDEQIEASDVGWASLDVLVFASAVKVLRVGRNVAVTTKTASRGTRSAALTARVISGGRLVLNSARYAKWPLLLGGAYLVITHPSLINDFLAEVAGIIGLPAFVVQFLGWILLLLPALFLIRALLWFAMPLIKTGLWSFSLLLARISGRGTA